MVFTAGVSRGCLGSPLAFNAAGSVDLGRVLEHGLHELAQQTVHVALAAREQALQEGDVAAVGRQQQRHVGQSADGRQREGCSGGQRSEVISEGVQDCDLSSCIVKPEDYYRKVQKMIRVK